MSRSREEPAGVVVTNLQVFSARKWRPRSPCSQKPQNTRRVDAPSSGLCTDTHNPHLVGSQQLQAAKCTQDFITGRLS